MKGGHQWPVLQQLQEQVPRPSRRSWAAPQHPRWMFWAARMDGVLGVSVGWLSSWRWVVIKLGVGGGPRQGSSGEHSRIRRLGITWRAGAVWGTRQRYLGDLSRPKVCRTEGVDESSLCCACLSEWMGRTPPTRYPPHTLLASELLSRISLLFLWRRGSAPASATSSGWP